MQTSALTEKQFIAKLFEKRIEKIIKSAFKFFD